MFIIYCSIDSFIPTAIAPFLTKPGHCPKVYNEVEGEKLRTIKLKKVLSQGLILPLSVCDMIESELMIGLDVSFPLGIQKWEPPPEFKSADTRGTFPSYCPKSDQERIQNCFNDMKMYFSTNTWEMTEKLEGQSASYILYNDEYQVCSRNLSLKDSENNTFWNVSRTYDVENKMRTLGRNLMIQGEQCGPGISGNIYGLKDYQMFVYDVFDIDTQSWLNPTERRQLTEQLGLINVPVLTENFIVFPFETTLDAILTYADGKSVIDFTDTLREGLVFKMNSDQRVSWKSVSNKYLCQLDEKE